MSVASASIEIVIGADRGAGAGVPRRETSKRSCARFGARAHEWRNADPPGPIRVLVATKPVDFRKGMNGLAALVTGAIEGRSVLGRDLLLPREARRQSEADFWDGTGLCLFAKRLEAGKFQWPRIEDGVMRLSAAQLAALSRVWIGRACMFGAGRTVQAVQ